MNGGKFQELRWGGAAGVQTALQSKAEPRPSADELFMYSASLAQCLTTGSGERVSQGTAEPALNHNAALVLLPALLQQQCMLFHAVLPSLFCLWFVVGGKAEQVGI